MPKRVQSASSINMYKQCPRKYFYAYVMGLPTAPNIHMIRGNVVHKVLEKFFDLDVAGVTKEDCGPFLQGKLIELLVHQWDRAKPEFGKAGVTPVENIQFKEESVVMLFNWLNHFISRVQAMPCLFPECFRKLTPSREGFFESSRHMVRGYIDAIENVDGTVHIIDYKTSKEEKLSDEYVLQMAIYVLLYHEKHGELPQKASFFFLKHRPVDVPVDTALVDHAVREVKEMHARTEHAKTIEEYPMQPGPLCRWCDFYKKCFPGKNGVIASQR